MTGAIPPAPPPPPPAGQVQGSWRAQQEQVTDWRPPAERTNEGASSDASKDFRVEVNGSEVPKALASAFNDPRKDKRPFSYFKTGLAPDLSENPSPSSLRKSNPHPEGALNLPKVLPIVSEDELEAEETRAMPYSHLQYNSPLNLYSQNNVDEAITQQTGGGSFGPKDPKFNIEDSATYKLIHEMDRGEDTRLQGSQAPRSQYTAQQFDPPKFRVKEEDYPHYEGFVNPNVQSPSFKKIQMSTIGANYADDAGSRAQSVPSETARLNDRWGSGYDADRRFTGIDRQDMNPSPSFHNIQRMTGELGFQSRELQGPMQTELHSPGQGGRQPPNFSMRDSAEEQQRELQSMDPYFAAQIAQAEQPKVPPPQAPDWANAAAKKQEQWERAPVNPDSYQRPRYAAGAEVEPNWSAAAQQNLGINPYQDEYYKKHYPTGSEVRPSWSTQRAQGAKSPLLTTQDELYRKHYATGAEVAPEWSTKSTTSQDKWDAHYHNLVAHQGKHAHGQPQGYLPQGYQQQHQNYQQMPQPYSSNSPRPRARSTEPPNWRGNRSSQRQTYSSQTMGRQKESWLKPYIAPNIDTSPRGGAQTPAPLMQSRSEKNVGTSSGAHHHVPVEFGSYYGPERGGFYRPGDQRNYSRSQSSHSYRTTNYSTQQAQPSGPIYRPQEIGGRDYYTLPAPKKQITPAAIVSGYAEQPGPVDQVVPAWQQTAEYKRQIFDAAGGVQEPPRPQPSDPAPNWAHTANQKRDLWESHSTRIDPQVHRQPVTPGPPPQWAHKADQTRTLYDHEADALKQRGLMETELHRRSQKSYQSSTQTHTGTSPYAPGTFTTITSGPVAKPLWQPAQAASTKSQLSGTYKDPQGHDVAYKKEVYTTSDPGKEFQMETKEEKKVFEEPLEPGVLSRKTTTKYYKKSTFNSTSTTSTTQAPPAVSFTQMPMTLEPPGPRGAGVTQF